MTNTHRIEIGTMTLTAPRDCDQSFECAAWSRTVTVAPGTYPVVGFFEWRDGSLAIVQANVIATGVVKAASFVSLFGGNRIPGSRDRGADEVGKEHAASWRIGRAAQTDGLTITHPGVVVDDSYLGLGVVAGYRVVCVSHSRTSGETRPGLLVAKGAELPRVEQIKLAADVIARAKVAGYWDKSTSADDARSLFGIITHDDVRARASAALEAAGVSLFGITR